jgi:hypothetical protein
MKLVRALSGFIAWLAFTPLLLAQAPGSLDPTFLPNIQTPALGGTNFSELITLPDGKLLVAGFVNGDFKGVARLYADGNVDNTFREPNPPTRDLASFAPECSPMAE